MDQREKQLQSVGICQRFFYFLMKTFAAQALKPVILGPPVRHGQRQTQISVHGGRHSEFPLPRTIASIMEVDDSESVTSIYIEDETSALLCTNEERWLQGESKVIERPMCESERNSKAPRKMVSIKEEPEIIYYVSNKRKKNGMERQFSGNGGHDGEIRPLKSILKVGSNLSQTSFQAATKTPKNNFTMY